MQEDIETYVSDDILVIKGERKAESGVTNEDYVRNELDYGNFRRSVPLPPSVDTENIEAEIESGVLRITLRRSSEMKQKRVKINLKKQSTGSS